MLAVSRRSTKLDEIFRFCSGFGTAAVWDFRCGTVEVAEKKYENPAFQPFAQPDSSPGDAGGQLNVTYFRDFRVLNLQRRTGQFVILSPLRRTKNLLFLAHARDSRSFAGAQDDNLLAVTNAPRPRK